MQMSNNDIQIPL